MATRGFLTIFLISILTPWSALPITDLYGQPSDDPVSSYTMDVRLDKEANLIIGKELISWTNRSQNLVTELWFHLYWNAFKNNRTTLMSEVLRLNSPLVSGWREQDWGYCEILSLRLVNELTSVDTDLLRTMQYRHPDDQNVFDQTVFSITLPRALEPGQAVQLAIDFRSKIPRPIYNAGVFKDFYFVCQWYPKLGVFINGQWNCHQHHYGSEYFSDYSTYDVSLNLPASYVIGATGQRIKKVTNPDATVTHHFHQNNVHDFAWTASPSFLEYQENYEFAPGKTTEIHLLLQPFHSHLKNRYLNALKAALTYSSSALFPYPYSTITCVDPIRNCRCSGMEYPTLFTGGAYFIAPKKATRPEGVTIHEFMHNYFYGIIGTNEFEDAWMDEGMTSFFDSEAYDFAYGEPLFTKSYFGIPLTFRDVRIPIESEGMIYYIQAPDQDIPQRLSWEYRDTKSLTANVYGKGEILLRTLQRLLGEAQFSEMIKSYARQWSFRHPKPEDFIRVLGEYAPPQITDFMRQALTSSEKMDYSIDEIHNRRIPPFQGHKGSVSKLSDPETYESEVLVSRRGALTVPVDVLVILENGDKIVKTWDGRYGWERLLFKGRSRIESAIVDPDFKLVLDVNRSNNSRTIKPNKFGPLKWTSKWLFWLQHAFELLTMFAG